MAKIEVTCPNPDCGRTFNVSEDNEFVRCGGCGIKFNKEVSGGNIHKGMKGFGRDEDGRILHVIIGGEREE